MEKFRRLAFKSVADKLEDPSDQKQAERIDPQAVKEAAQNKQWDGKQDGRDTERVARAVHRMLVTGAVLRDPFLVAASAKHGQDDITIRSRKNSCGGGALPRQEAARCARLGVRQLTLSGDVYHKFMYRSYCIILVSKSR